MLYIKLIIKLDKTYKWKPILIVKDIMDQTFINRTVCVYMFALKLPFKSCINGIKPVVGGSKQDFSEVTKSQHNRRRQQRLQIFQKNRLKNRQSEAWKINIK